MSGGCDFHEIPKGDCVHCLGYQLALAREEIARVRGDGRPGAPISRVAVTGEDGVTRIITGRRCLVIIADQLAGEDYDDIEVLATSDGPTIFEWHREVES